MSLPTSFTTQSGVNQAVINENTLAINQQRPTSNEFIPISGAPAIPSSPPKMKTRIRSESSPPTLITPSIPLLPSVPSLNLRSVAPVITTQASPVKSETSGLYAVSSPTISSRVKILDTAQGNASASPTPRKSPRPVAEYQPSSVRQSIKSPGKDRHPDIQPIPSPRKLDKALIVFADEIASHCVNAMMGNGATSDTNPMRVSDVQALLRQDLKISMDELSPELRARLPNSFTSSTISHSALINAMYSGAFRSSKAGKTLLATRQSVMDDYSNSQLTIAELAIRLEADPAIKQRYKQNMDDRALEFANFVFGLNSRFSPGSIISPELLYLWKAMDRKLSAVGAGREGRERLAYDLILTRMVLRTAKGDDADSALAIPTLLFASIKEACARVFPAFAAKLIQSFDNERPGSDSNVISGTTSVSTTTNSSATTTSTRGASIGSTSGNTPNAVSSNNQ